VFRVVLLGCLAWDRDQPHLVDRQPLGFDPAQDLADEAPTNTVGLDDQQR